jgi:hypothetical protein
MSFTNVPNPVRRTNNPIGLGINTSRDSSTDSLRGSGSMVSHVSFFSQTPFVFRGPLCDDALELALYHDGDWSGVVMADQMIKGSMTTTMAIRPGFMLSTSPSLPPLAVSYATMSQLQQRRS